MMAVRSIIARNSLPLIRIPFFFCILLAACSQPSDAGADQSRGPPVPADLAQSDASAQSDFSAPIRKKLIPTSNGICRFEERDPRDRPTGLIQTNWHSNVIFWTDRGAGLWDHPNGLIYDEGMVIPGKRIIAARDGMKDLWISPAVEEPIYLYSGPEIFECRQPSTR